MGWTYLWNVDRRTRQAYLDKELTWENEQVRARLVKSMMVGSVYYAAVESIRKADGSRQVWAAIHLTKLNPRDKDGYTFGYKDMSEDMGPFESTCPPSILDLLTETESEYATAWRARCRAHAAIRARPAPLVGTKIRLAKPLTFADETCHSEFTVVQYVRRGRKRTAYRARNGWLCRIPNIRTRDYEVIDGPVSGAAAG